MREVDRAIDEVASTRRSVLILGETGTGKDVVARELHARSARSGGAWIAVNCAGLASDLADSELHGHVKGAFTGAATARAGLIKSAHGGSVFLDEIGELPFAVQNKLLRTLEDRSIRPCGADTSEQVDVRFIAATSADLEKQILAGKSKRDFFARFSFKIMVPPLRDRRDDIPDLAAHFVEALKGDEGMNGNARRISQRALDRLSRHTWPANVRELRHAVETALTRSKAAAAEELDLEHFEFASPPPVGDEQCFEVAEKAIGSVADFVLGELEAGRMPRAKIEAIARTLVAKHPRLSLSVQLADAFYARFRGQGLTAKALELFGYTDLQGVRRYQTDRPDNEQ